MFLPLSPTKVYGRLLIVFQFSICSQNKQTLRKLQNTYDLIVFTPASKINAQAVLSYEKWLFSQLILLNMTEVLAMARPA